MSEQAIVSWMKSIDQRLVALQASLVECQGRHRAAAAVTRVGGARRAKLVKTAVVLATGVLGALAQKYLNN